MLQDESKYVEDNADKLAALLMGIKATKERINIDELFSNLVSPHKEVKTIWEEQMNRWGTSFFSSVLPDRIIPDYFLFNGNLDTTKYGTIIKEVWDNVEILLNKLHTTNFKKPAAILQPQLTLFAVKSSLLPNARLARYFINKDMLKDMTQKMESVENNIYPQDKMYSSRYWQLIECVHGHLFDRSNFFSERVEQSSENKNCSKLLIVITNNKRRSLGYLKYSNEILYINRKIAFLLGSELNPENDPSTDIDTELLKIKEKIAFYCANSVRKDLDDKIAMSPEYVHFKITQIAPNIAAEVRNMFDFDSKRKDRIAKALDMLFEDTSSNANKVMNSLKELFKIMMPVKKNETLTEKLRVLITSLFDLFMILPKSKSYLFNYAYGNDMDLTWAIVGKGPDDEKLLADLKDPYNLDPIYKALNAQKSAIYDAHQNLYKRNQPFFKLNCRKLRRAIQGSSELPDDLMELKKNFIIEIIKGDNDAAKKKGLYALCLTLEACSYLTGEEHENNPLTFIFLISGSQSWHAFDSVISDGELFYPEKISKSKKWEAKQTGKMIKANYSILQIPRVVAFFDRSQVWDDEGLSRGQVARIEESKNNKGLIGYPFFYNSGWKNIKNWEKAIS